MRLHTQELAAFKTRRKKSLKQKLLPIDQSLARPRCPKITIARNRGARDGSDDPVRILPRLDESSSIIDADDIIACDIIELLCEDSENASDDNGAACSQISSSTELGKNGSICVGCTECQLQRKEDTVGTISETKGTLSGQNEPELAEHLDYYEGHEVDADAASSSFVSIGHEKAPVIMDLISEGSRQATWKRIVLKRYSDAEENSEMGEAIIDANNVCIP